LPERPEQPPVGARCFAQSGPLPFPFTKESASYPVSRLACFVRRKPLADKHFRSIRGGVPTIVTDSSVEYGGGANAEGPASLGSSLLGRLKTDSSQAWRRLIRLYGPLVYQWCRHSGLQRADAKDVGQEVFSAVASRIGGFRRSLPGDTFRGWLWTITRSKIADYGRRRQKQPRAVGGSTAQLWMNGLAADDAAGTDQAGEPAIPGSLFQRGLELIRKEFEARTWKAFWRVAVDGCPPAMVAEETGLSVNSVYLAKSRVLRRLREELGDITL
jgi:RNA polymerase sigma-70 factor (ECF subfamily)